MEAPPAECWPADSETQQRPVPEHPTTVSSEQLAALVIVSDSYGSDIYRTIDRAAIQSRAVWALLRSMAAYGLVRLDQASVPYVLINNQVAPACGWAELTDHGRSVLAGGDMDPSATAFGDQITAPL
jgi:hypothetical protein